MDTATQRHSDTATQRHSDTATQRHSDTATQRHSDYTFGWFRRKQLIGCSLAALMTAFPSAVVAQESEPATQEEVELEEDEDSIEEVVVTGSRLRRSTFNSASPMQVISGDLAREAGLFDVGEILQATSQTSGLQINNAFNSFVLDNGIGAVTVGYRGLGADRTLVMINGRRMAPAGVGGAPSSPDLNLIPAALISRIENVFDGASAVYGSDAVAGVSNVILRSDVDGFEILASGDAPEAGGGKSYTVTGLYGKTGDNWNVTAAVEYSHNNSLTYSDSKFFNACDEFRFEDEDGNLLTQFRGLAPGTTDSACRLDTINRALIGDRIFGNVWATPGETNIGIPGWSETIIGGRLARFAPDGTVTQIDSNGDGELDDEFLVDPDQNGVSEIDIQSPFYNFARSARAQQGDLFGGLRRLSAYGLGSYNFEDSNNTELYFEALYARRDSDIFTPGSRFFPTVPGTNPFNITNPDGLGVNSLNFFGVDFGAFEVIPVIVVRGDRDFNDVRVAQYRLVGGVRGNAGFMDGFLGGNWSYDAYVTHSRSSGTDSQTGINGDRVELSLETTIEDPANPGSYICGADADGDGVPDGTDGCVPLNPFAASLYQAGGGTFGSRAETDYFISVRSFETIIEQTIANGTIQGDLFDLPNGAAVPLLVGYEFRRDRIDSIPNDIAANGSLFAFFSDRGAKGTRYLNEIFAETSLNLLRDKKFAEDLTLDLSARLTDESAFKPHFTWSGKLLYRPLSWVTLRGTYGTSYRAPNLRERFLVGTTGFVNRIDPCVVPNSAREGTSVETANAPEVYLENEDPRLQVTLDACRAQGLDPTSLGLETGAGDAFTATTSVETVRRGSLDLDPETSRSLTLGFVLEQPFTDSFDLKFSLSWFNIDIRDGVATPGSLFILNDCYRNPLLPEATSAFCSRVVRDGDGRLTDLDLTFLNVGQETSRGIDLDLNYQQDFEIGDELLSVSLDVNATYISRLSEQILDTDTDFAGRPAVPRWRANTSLILDYRDFRFNWFTRWIQRGENIPGTFQENSVPCDGLPVSCRPIYYTTNYDVHNASLTYNWGDYSLNVGVRNVFNTAPPQVDSGGVFSDRNVPLGIGYDLFGRTFYTNISARF